MVCLIIAVAPTTFSYIVVMFMYDDLQNFILSVGLLFHYHAAVLKVFSLNLYEILIHNS